MTRKTDFLQGDQPAPKEVLGLRCGESYSQVRKLRDGLAGNTGKILISYCKAAPRPRVGKAYLSKSPRPPPWDWTEGVAQH